jgi:hypothetical protein
MGPVMTLPFPVRTASSGYFFFSSSSDAELMQ